MGLIWHWKDFQELSTTELYQILEARQVVFIVEQKINCIDCDGLDQESWHCWGVDQNRLAAYLRVIKPGVKYQEPSIGRVLTMPEYRGQGYGKEIMQFSLDRIKHELGEGSIRMSAQSYLERFYTDLGFKTVSEPYIEEGIEHIQMLSN